MADAEKAEIAWLDELIAELEANRTPRAQRINAEAARWRKRKGLSSTGA